MKLPSSSAKQSEKISEIAIKFLYGSFLALLIVLPFHAFLTTWLGTEFGARDIFRSWKEILLVLMSVSAFWLFVKDTKLRTFALSYKLNWLIVAYIILNLLYAIFFSTEIDQELMGLKLNIGFLLVFLLTQIVGFYYSDVSHLKLIIRIILFGSAAVAAFAVLQAWVLPPDFLTHFGYGPETIEPFLLIQDSSEIRVISTLDGPSQLGQFLIFPIALSVFYFIKKRDYRYVILTVLLMAGQYVSHSRSAWIGAIIAVSIVVAMSVNRKTLTMLALLGLMISVLGAAIIIPRLDDSKNLQAIILHSNYEKSLTASSNSDHLILANRGLSEVKKTPFGRGPGTAGPASFLADEVKRRIITENYYIQLAIELGVLGCLMFITIIVWLGRKLFAISRSHELAVPIFASLIALSFVGLLLHVWASTIVALIFWATAGYAISIQTKKATQTSKF